MAPKKSIKHANSNLPVRVTQGSVSITRHSAIFMEGDGDPLISPSSCSQVLDAIVTHPKNHTQNSLNALWSRGLNLSTAKQDWKKKFLIQGFSEAVTEEVVCWIFFFPPLLLWEFKAQCWPLQRPLSHLLKIKPLIPALKTQYENLCCLHTMQCLGVKNRVHLASYLHNKHVSFKCLIWYSH